MLFGRFRLRHRRRWPVHLSVLESRKAESLGAQGPEQRARHRQLPWQITEKPRAYWRSAGAAVLFHLQTAAKQNHERSNASRERDFAEQANAATDAGDARVFSQRDATRCESEPQAGRNRLTQLPPLMNGPRARRRVTLGVCILIVARGTEYLLVDISNSY